MRGACVGLLFACLCWGQASRPAAPIAGRVVHALSGEKLAGVRVKLSAVDGLRPELGSVITDSNGRFRFLVERGKYILAAESHELGRQFYGSRSMADPFPVATIANGVARHEQLELKMYPAAAITGRVVDPHGEPVENALVQVLRANIIAGRKQLSIRGFWRTDDRGEFRAGGLSSGSYYLVVGGTPWHNNDRYFNSTESKEMRLAYVPTYYPDTQNPAAAAALELAAGTEARANFTLSEGSGANVRVTLNGYTEKALRVDLIAEGIAGLNRFQYVGNLYGAQMKIPAVPPGKYRVKISGNLKGTNMEGWAPVDVGSADESVSITMEPLATVSGKMTCEGKAVPQGHLMWVLLWDAATNRSFSKRLDADGAFSITQVEPGRRQVVVIFAHECYPSRVLLDGKELKQNVLEVGRESVSGLTIEGVRGVAALKGFVRNQEEKRSGVFVLLTPVQESPDPEAYQKTKTDSDGSFDFRSVRPGEYWLYAVDVDDFEYANRSVIEPYLKRAKKIVVPAFGKLTQDLEVIEPK